MTESTDISEAVLIIFFENFVTFGTEDFFEKHARTPAEDEEVVRHSREFELAGLSVVII